MLEVKANCSLGVTDIVDCGMVFLRMKIKRLIYETIEVTKEMLLKILNTFADKLDWIKEGILHFVYPSSEIKRIKKGS